MMICSGLVHGGSSLYPLLLLLHRYPLLRSLACLCFPLVVVLLLLQPPAEDRRLLYIPTARRGKKRRKRKRRNHTLCGAWVLLCLPNTGCVGAAVAAKLPHLFQITANENVCGEKRRCSRSTTATPGLLYIYRGGTELIKRIALQPKEKEDTKATLMQTSQQVIDTENRYSAHNYHPLPVVFHKAKGCTVWDPEGKQYLDFLSAYSALNQGHCHPRIIDALVKQASNLTLSSRAFHNDVYPVFAKFITDYFGFDKVLPMNTGVEAVETAIKIARKYGYDVKKIKADNAVVIGFQNNFHGRTLGAISLSTDTKDSRLPQFGPFVPNLVSSDEIRYGEIDDIVKAFNKYGPENIAAIIIEPIQGEAGIIVPPDNYMEQLYKLCRKNNVLFICDEIQTGIGRTGKMLCYEHYPNVKPDIVLLGKALSGGVLPVSCVLTSNKIMSVITPGTHGSTFGGNPLSSAVAMEALKVIKDEKLVENAAEMGSLFMKELLALQDSPQLNGMISQVRGKGLLLAMVIDPEKAQGRTAWDLCLLMKKNGLLAKPTHKHIIRLAPPLIITKSQLQEGIEIIKKSLFELPTAPISGE